MCFCLYEHWGYKMRSVLKSHFQVLNMEWTYSHQYQPGPASTVSFFVSSSFVWYLLKSTQPFSSLLHPYFPQPLPIGYLDNKLSHTYVDSSVQNPILRVFSWGHSHIRLLYSPGSVTKGYHWKLGNWGGLKKVVIYQKAGCFREATRMVWHPVLIPAVKLDVKGSSFQNTERRYVDKAGSLACKGHTNMVTLQGGAESRNTQPLSSTTHVHTVAYLEVRR